jgi:hypothetical protein
MELPRPTRRRRRPSATPAGYTWHGRRVGGGYVRCLIYFLAPVPLALLCFLGIGMLMDGPRTFGLDELAAFLVLGLGWGYAIMGIQSAVFAILMLFLERRSMEPGPQAVAAVVLGGLCGGSVALWGMDSAVMFAAIGAVVAPSAMCVGHLIAPRIAPPDSRRSGRFPCA